MDAADIVTKQKPIPLTQQNFVSENVEVGLVRRILTRLGEESRDVAIDAQLYLEKFYSDFGFVRDGEPYDDVGVPHVKMRVRLHKAPL